MEIVGVMRLTSPRTLGRIDGPYDDDFDRRLLRWVYGFVLGRTFDGCVLGRIRQGPVFLSV